MLAAFSGEPVPLNELTIRYAPDTMNSEILIAWLQLGMKLKEIQKKHDGYCLKGLSKLLARPYNDEYSALVQEVAGIHHNIILRAPKILKTNKKWAFRDHDGELIARSSRTLEPFVVEAMDSTFPLAGSVRLLEIGCGTAVYIRLAAEKNPDLCAVGLELQQEVAEMAAQNIQNWGLQDRVAIEYRDIRQFSDENGFDITTLYNNIYYFTVSERTQLFRQIHSLLKPGGCLLLTTSCQDGSPLIEALNLWCVTTQGYARLPAIAELTEQMHDAGFTRVSSLRLIPGDSYYAVTGYRL